MDREAGLPYAVPMDNYDTEIHRAADQAEAEAHLETANILSDPDTMAALREAEDDIASGRVSEA